jgi:hypothetical protein
MVARAAALMAVLAELSSADSRWFRWRSVDRGVPFISEGGHMVATLTWRLSPVSGEISAIGVGMVNSGVPRWPIQGFRCGY